MCYGFTGDTCQNDATSQPVNCTGGFSVRKINISNYNILCEDENDVEPGDTCKVSCKKKILEQI